MKGVTGVFDYAVLVTVPLYSELGLLSWLMLLQGFGVLERRVSGG